MSGGVAARLLGVAALTALLSGCATKGDLRDVRVDMRSIRLGQDQLLQELQRQDSLTADTERDRSDQLVGLQGSVSQLLRDILAELEMLRELTGANQQAISQMRDQMVQLSSQVSRRGVPQPSLGGGGPIGAERRAGQNAVAPSTSLALFTAFAATMMAVGGVRTVISRVTVSVLVKSSVTVRDTD